MLLFLQCACTIYELRNFLPIDFTGAGWWVGEYDLFVEFFLRSLESLVISIGVGRA